MPKGKFESRGRGSGGGHKGQRRHFTNPDQLAENKEKEERERRWREQRGEISSEESEQEESSSSESEEEKAAEKNEEPKAKGVQHLIEIENPNRVVKKDKKVSELQVDAEGPQLSRREREEIEKQKAKAQYQRLHAAGRTAEAKEDLARLAIIRKQREEAAKKREEEQRAKQKAEAAKMEATKKATGKKT